MAMLATGSLVLPAHSVQTVACRSNAAAPQKCAFFVAPKFSKRLRTSSVLAASSSTAPSVSPGSSSGSPAVDFDLACPICQTTKFTITQPNGSPVGDMHCPRCRRHFSNTGAAVDLTLTSGVPPGAYEQRSWAGTELFRSPLVSLAYERGWRQSFAWAGFPGVDKEADIAMTYLAPAYGDVVVDMSCGSGLFSRKFLGSGRFKGVIAADFSESMVQEARSFFDQDRGIDSRKYVLVRADVARLPFATGSVAAVHAGAAIHCWPNPLAAVAEISRVLRPGGVFVASTFLSLTAPLGEVVGDALLRPLRQLEPTRGSYRFWDEEELRDLCATVGLQNFVRERRNRFILFCATKPGGGGV